jgi:membrane-anchored glycerophosphoryl diester phosphodiesterase (GDPDase)
VFGYLAFAATVVAVGTAAFVLPGIVAAARLFLGVPAIVLDGSGVVTAGRQSWVRTAGRQLSTAGLVVVLGVAWVVLAGLPLLGVPVATAVVGTVGLATATVLYRRPD